MDSFEFLTDYLHRFSEDTLHLVGLGLGLLGSIVANLVMVVIFIVVITPTGMLMRRLRQNYLDLRVDPSLKTYWISRSMEQSSTASLRNQF